MKLCLGTAQFGMDYGINNQKKPPISDSIEMLDYATQNGVLSIDTAAAYGNAEEIVGEFLKKKTIERSKLIITSKLLPNILADVKEKDYYKVIKSEAEKSLKKLNISCFDGYMSHTAPNALSPEILYALSRLKADGMATKTGISVYEPEEAFACINDVNTEIIQAPFSIFDQRFNEAKVFDFNINLSTEIHIRSAFIQGLITLAVDQVPDFLDDAKPLVKKIYDFCKEEHISPVLLAIKFCMLAKNVSHLVVGVDNIKQLKQNIEYFNLDFDVEVIEEIFEEFKNIKAEIVMPSLWKR